MTGWTAALGGSALGALAGWLSRVALRRALRSSDVVFYPVFGGGLLARLALLVGAVWCLRRENYIIIILFAVPMIIVQTVSLVFPLKHGTKSDP